MEILNIAKEGIMTEMKVVGRDLMVKTDIMGITVDIEEKGAKETIIDRREMAEMDRNEGMRETEYLL